MSNISFISNNRRLILAVVIVLLAYIMLLRSAPTFRTLTTLPLLSRISKPTSSILHSYIPTARPFSTTKMANQLSFLDAVRERRSIYPLTSKTPIDDKRISEIVLETIKHVPSSFDSRSSRLVVLLNEDHTQFWDFVKEVLAPHAANEEARKGTEQRLDGFRAGKGTV